MSRFLPVFSIFLIFLINFQSYSQVTVKNLKCEYLENPVGLDETHPRFTWQMELHKPGNYQSAYQLVVGTIETDVASGRGDVWESGVVASSVIPVVYGVKSVYPVFLECTGERRKPTMVGLVSTQFF